MIIRLFIMVVSDDRQNDKNKTFILKVNSSSHDYFAEAEMAAENRRNLLKGNCTTILDSFVLTTQLTIKDRTSKTFPSAVRPFH